MSDDHMDWHSRPHTTRHSRITSSFFVFVVSFTLCILFVLPMISSPLLRGLTLLASVCGSWVLGHLVWRIEKRAARRHIEKKRAEQRADLDAIKEKQLEEFRAKQSRIPKVKR